MTHLLDVVLIVVSYRSASHLGRLLDSVAGASGDLRVSAVVVDNAGEDNVGAVVERYPWATLVRAPTNLGYSGGINVGLSSAPAARGVCVLNPDVELMPQSLVRLLAAAERHGAAVPLLQDAGGRTRRSIRREPSVLGAWGEALLGDHLARRPGRFSEMVRSDDAYRRAGAVDWATGAVLMTSQATVDAVGRWDDRYFLYSEETDYCRRIREAGYEVWFDPGAVAVHEEGGSGRSSALTALLAVNRVRYFKRTNGPVRQALFAGAVAIQHLLRSGAAEQRVAVRALLSRRARRRLPGEVRVA